METTTAVWGGWRDEWGPGAGGPEDVSTWEAAWAACLRRARAWRIPPHWSPGDWWDELRAQAVAAAWQALREFDPARGAALGTFLRRRVLAGLLARSRQEWAFALRRADAARDAPAPRGADDPGPAALARERLHGPLGRLAAADRDLLRRLFWDGCTEAQLAAERGVSQQAINKRKRAVLRALRRDLGRDGQIPGFVVVKRPDLA